MRKPLPIPAQSQALTGKGGEPTPHAYRFLDSFRSGLLDLDSEKAARSQTWEQAFFIQYPENGDLRLVLNAQVARTITSVTTRCTTGTATLTVKINTTALGGSTNSVSTTEQTRTHSSANAVAVGDDIVFTFSSVSSCEGVSILLAGTLVLA